MSGAGGVELQLTDLCRVLLTVLLADQLRHQLGHLLTNLSGIYPALLPGHSLAGGRHPPAHISRVESQARSSTYLSHSVSPSWIWQPSAHSLTGILSHLESNKSSPLSPVQIVSQQILQPLSSSSSSFLLTVISSKLLVVAAGFLCFSSKVSLMIEARDFK